MMVNLLGFTQEEAFFQVSELLLFTRINSYNGYNRI